MASEKELSDFLKASEKRAFKQVFYSVRDEDAALDIVQDSMIKLAQSYGDKNIEELPLLFTRIVQNCMKDWFRRQKVRNTWVTLFSKFGKNDDGEDIDPQDFFENSEDSSFGKESSLQIERMELSTILEMKIKLISHHLKFFVVLVQTIVTFMQLMMELPADFQKIKLIQP
jgi:RNA polymerase sigma-70 factor (ECF subfamily)